MSLILGTFHMCRNLIKDLLAKNDSQILLHVADRASSVTGVHLIRNRFVNDLETDLQVRVM